MRKCPETTSIRILSMVSNRRARSRKEGTFLEMVDSHLQDVLHTQSHLGSELASMKDNCACIIAHLEMLSLHVCHWTGNFSSFPYAHHEDQYIVEDMLSHLNPEPQSFEPSISKHTFLQHRTVALMKPCPEELQTICARVVSNLPSCSKFEHLPSVGTWIAIPPSRIQSIGGASVATSSGMLSGSFSDTCTSTPHSDNELEFSPYQLGFIIDMACKQFADSRGLDINLLDEASLSLKQCYRTLNCHEDEPPVYSRVDIMRVLKDINLFLCSSTFAATSCIDSVIAAVGANAINSAPSNSSASQRHQGSRSTSQSSSRSHNLQLDPGFGKGPPRTRKKAKR